MVSSHGKVEGLPGRCASAGRQRGTLLGQVNARAWPAAALTAPRRRDADVRAHAQGELSSPRPCSLSCLRSEPRQPGCLAACAYGRWRSAIPRAGSGSGFGLVRDPRLERAGRGPVADSPGATAFASVSFRSQPLPRTGYPRHDSLSATTSSAATSRKPRARPSCPAHGSLSVLEALRRRSSARKLFDSVAVTACGSLGLCERAAPTSSSTPKGSGTRMSRRERTRSSSPPTSRGADRSEGLMRRGRGGAHAGDLGNRGHVHGGAPGDVRLSGAVPDELDVTPPRSSCPAASSYTGPGAGRLHRHMRAPASSTPATRPSVAAALKTDLRATTALSWSLVRPGAARQEGRRLRERTPGVSLPRRRRQGTTPPPRSKHNLSLWTDVVHAHEVVRTRGAPSTAARWTRAATMDTPFIAAMHKNVGLRGCARVVKAGGARARAG
jgi:hypothetical protein